MSEHSIPVRNIWLRRNGGENDPHATVTVEVELEDGRYYEVIRENLSNNFSHCVSSYGIQAARSGDSSPNAD